MQSTDTDENDPHDLTSFKQCTVRFVVEGRSCTFCTECQFSILQQRQQATQQKGMPRVEMLERHGNVYQSTTYTHHKPEP